MRKSKNPESGSFLQTEFWTRGSKIILKHNVVDLFGLGKIVKLTKPTSPICILSYVVTLNQER